MFIRAVQTSQGKPGTSFNNHQLVEGYPTEARSRQRLNMNRGSLDLPRERWKDLAAALEVGVTGQWMLFPPDPDIAALADDLPARRGRQHRTHAKAGQVDDIPALIPSIPVDPLYPRRKPSRDEAAHKLPDCADPSLPFHEPGMQGMDGDARDASPASSA